MTGDDEPHRVTGRPGPTARPRWAGRCRCCGSARPTGCGRCCRCRRPARAARAGTVHHRGAGRRRGGRRPRPRAGARDHRARLGAAAGHLRAVDGVRGGRAGARPADRPEAEHELTAATRDAASALAALDVASWRPEVAEGLARMRRGVTPELPPGHDARAVRLLGQADRLAAVLDLAGADAPAARSPAPRPGPATTRCARCDRRPPGPPGRLQRRPLPAPLTPRGRRPQWDGSQEGDVTPATASRLD